MKLQALSQPQLPPVPQDHVVFGQIAALVSRQLNGNAFAITLVSVLMLLAQSLYLNHITVKHKLFARSSYFPAFAYLVLTSLHPSYSYFSEPLLLNWVILWAVNMMMTLSQTSQPRKQIFNAGFIICVPLLFQVSYLGLLALFLLALMFLRSFNLGEWTVGILGYLTPVYFFTGILFLMDQLNVLKNILQIGTFSGIHIDHPLYFSGLVGGLSLLLAIGSAGVQQQMTRMTIYIRRSWGLVYTYLAIGFGIALFSAFRGRSEWLILMPPLALVIAQAFCFEKTKRFSNFTFYFFLIVLTFCQLALNK